MKINELWRKTWYNEREYRSEALYYRWANLLGWPNLQSLYIL